MLVCFVTVLSQLCRQLSASDGEVVNMTADDWKCAAHGEHKYLTQCIRNNKAVELDPDECV